MQEIKGKLKMIIKENKKRRLSKKWNRRENRSENKV